MSSFPFFVKETLKITSCNFRFKKGVLPSFSAIIVGFAIFPRLIRNPYPYFLRDFCKANLPDHSITYDELVTNRWRLLVFAGRDNYRFKA